MNILVLDPFYEDSHKAWAEGLKKYSTHKVEILSLSPHHWKWRMTGGAIELAESYNELNYKPDLILATDMLDLAAFISLAGIDQTRIAIAIYFHENQITYPWNANTTDLQKEKNYHYGFINFTSCLVPDKIFFNSDFHRNDFLHALPSFLKIFPKFSHKKYVEEIINKSHTLSLGLDLKNYSLKKSETPCFVWNHRWEHDKNPEGFFNTLFQLKKEGVNFELIVLGKSYERQPPIFNEAKEHLKAEIIHFGFAPTIDEYHKLINQANILLVTSNQDFFGISIVEAIAAGLHPILPRRLAYPEHLEENYKEIFYENDEEIIPLVKSVISSKKYLEKSIYADQVQRYQWSNMIKLYDDQFSEMKKPYI